MAALTEEELEKIKIRVMKRYNPFYIKPPEIACILAEVNPNSSGLPFDISKIEPEDSFMDHLYTLMDKHHFEKDPDVYNKAGIDPSTWGKYKNNGVLPKKHAVICIALAMKLNLKETRELLERSNNAFSPSSKSDLVIESCIARRYYDVEQINQAMYMMGEPVFETQFSQDN